MYQSLHIDMMVCLFERFFSDEITPPAKTPILEFNAHPRIRIDVYKDDPCHVALFHVDTIPVLRESLIEGLDEFMQKTRLDRNLHAFLLEMAT